MPPLQFFLRASRSQEPLVHPSEAGAGTTAGGDETRRDETRRDDLEAGKTESSYDDRQVRLELDSLVEIESPPREDVNGWVDPINYFDTNLIN